MNKLGVENFKKTVSIGDELSVNTREYSYYGNVTSIDADSFEIDEGGLKFNIYYAHVWAYSIH
ncbi:hypothetical protein FAY30_26975 (plasmid) [Bacillus sp. S3]|uniref:hypothetical protein n=1 Tax=Bacillus sp. S3 TaxID=486398 RepID=UPI0011879EE6|nr:hypothetical protein [Bacillus sp. S3]QCJ45576.1 hypothetical protein FAY30_26975 [Bacillus sp. S3]